MKKKVLTIDCFLEEILKLFYLNLFVIFLMKNRYIFDIHVQNNYKKNILQEQNVIESNQGKYSLFLLMLLHQT